MNGPGQILPFAAARRPAKTALITATRSLTYAELDDLSTRVACGLLRRGVTCVTLRTRPLVAVLTPRMAPRRPPAFVRV